MKTGVECYAFLNVETDGIRTYEKHIYLINKSNFLTLKHKSYSFNLTKNIKRY